MAIKEQLIVQVGNVKLLYLYDEETALFTFDPDDETEADAELNPATADVIEIRLVNNSRFPAKFQMKLQTGRQIWKEGTIRSNSIISIPVKDVTSERTKVPNMRQISYVFLRGQHRDLPERS